MYYNYLCDLFSMIYVWVSSCVYIGLNFVFICMGVFQEKYLEYLEYLYSVLDLMAIGPDQIILFFKYLYSSML